MGTFSITTYNKQLVILYNSEEGDEIQLSSITFFNPSVEVKGNKFSFFESGTYKKSISFKEIYLINDVEPIDSEDAFNKIIEGIANFNRGGAAPYKVYTALLTQNGGDGLLNINRGQLTIGITYFINDFSEGMDFTNVGAPNNNVGTSFVATGTTPNSWGTDEGIGYILVFNTGAPVVTVLENTIGNIYWTYSNIGNYRANLVGAFPEVKTFILTPSTGYDSGVLQAGGGEPYSICRFSDDQILIAIGSDSNLNNTPIEIRVYN